MTDDLNNAYSNVGKKLMQDIKFLFDIEQKVSDTVDDYWDSLFILLISTAIIIIIFSIVYIKNLKYIETYIEKKYKYSNSKDTI